jgi:hypothetical protein
MWWHQRSGRTTWAFVLAIALFAAGSARSPSRCSSSVRRQRDRDRLESWPRRSRPTNDQLALVSWFQRATPRRLRHRRRAVVRLRTGGNCSGVPAQIHSDYTFTAIVGVFGATAPGLASLGCASGCTA